MALELAPAFAGIEIQIYLNKQYVVYSSIILSKVVHLEKVDLF